MTPYLSWDVADTLQNYVEFLTEENNTPIKEAEKRAYDDMDIIIQQEWEWLCDELETLINKINPDGYWHAEVRNFGWRSTDGKKDFHALTGAEFLAQVLPDTDNTFNLYVESDAIKINNAHHDSPCWAEWYTITPGEPNETL